MNNNCIETKNLTKSYGKARGIREVSLVVEEGEIFGFIGPNGAGKSTTIRSLLGMITPSAGEAKIFNLDVRKNRKEILQGIGYMPSEAMFYTGMRVGDIIQYSADLHKKDCSKEADILCDRLKLDKKKKVEELSLGNRKKVSIICAMQHDPKLYILDEPTSGLDPLMQREFFNLLEEKHKQGATLFMSSHVLSEIQHHCTKAAIIREGRIIVSDTVEALSKTNTRRVALTIMGNEKIAKQLEERLTKQIKDLNIKASGAELINMEFLYTGDMNALVQYIGQTNIVDIRITEPDLEEIFMHYYTNGGMNNDCI
ncbi:ABC transporter ATP-binding protein [Anaerosporobacter faecicola]|uniref:ABC transporter ATP-binding protein n=1 Tax=Anaerosporobacter faecicola TaxID=2718714 RepID=UPI00143B7E15|nr:ABC transporter ATP-binding protein [Anaerosporobacter faecicola]